MPRSINPSNEVQALVAWLVSVNVLGDSVHHRPKDARKLG